MKNKIDLGFLNKYKIKIMFIVILGIVVLLFINFNKRVTGSVIDIASDSICERDFCELDSILNVENVSIHNTQEDCWTIINGKVYDISDFVSIYMGDLEIVELCGIDGSNMFKNKSGDNKVAKNTLENYYIGDLK